MKLENLKKKEDKKLAAKKTEDKILAPKRKLKKILLKSEYAKLKHFPSSVRAWNNSIYCFNKNNSDLIPSISTSAKSLIKSFFNSHKKIVRKKIKAKRLHLKRRRLSIFRVYLSDAQFKHTNNKILINLHIFNKQKLRYLDVIKRFYSEEKRKRLYFGFLLKKIRISHKKALKNWKKNEKSLLVRKKNLLLKALLSLETNFKAIADKSLRSYYSFFYQNKKKALKLKLIRFLKYKQLVYMNESKLNYTYLRILKKYMEKLFNKNVEFNLVNLKRFYLNSDILNEATKIKITRKRWRLRRIFKKLKNKIKIQKKSFFSAEVLEAFEEKDVLSNLKYRHVTGFRLQAKGRLRRRNTASRSVSRAVYAGNLLNIDSSERNLSAVLLKGYLKANMQYTKSQSKTKIGSFGLKGWISSN